MNISSQGNKDSGLKELDQLPSRLEFTAKGITLPHSSESQLLVQKTAIYYILNLS